ncbi:MAG: putative capsid protein [Eurynomevirus troutis]|uniref:Capsid protein n=1 Tax=Cressdnaviricota sp. TaxID=2748378 RepID=A0A345MXX7_9VIRU|nr:MAG: putative capsid protein [Cressdnaviricota sp.]
MFKRMRRMRIRRNRYKRRRTIRRKRFSRKRYSRVTANKIVQRAIKASQEYKYKQSDPLTVNDRLEFQEQQIGEDIDVGPGRDERVGDEITVTGIRIETQFTNTTPVSGITGQGRPVSFNIAVVSTMNDNTFDSQWYKTDVTANDKLSWSTLSLSNQRSLLTYRQGDYKVHWQKRITLVAELTNMTSKNPYHNGSYWIPLNMKIKFHTGNVPITDRTLIKPNLSVVMWTTIPFDADDTGGNDNPQAGGYLEYITYWRE